MSNVSRINKNNNQEAPTPETWRYKTSGLRKFVGAVAVVATLAGGYAMIEAGKQPDIFTQTDKTSEYTVQPGDSAWSIAGELDEQLDGVPGNMDKEKIIDDIVNRNPSISDPSKLQTGQEIIIPDFTDLVASRQNQG